MKKFIIISLSIIALMSCKSHHPSERLAGDWELIKQNPPPAQEYKQTINFSLPNIITITELTSTGTGKHSGEFTTKENQIIVKLKNKIYENTYSIDNGVLIINENEKMRKYRKIKK